MAESKVAGEEGRREEIEIERNEKEFKKGREKKDKIEKR